MKLVSVENLSFSYGRNPILKNLSLHLDRGETMIIKGESGSGKSTLINLLVGYQRPKLGSIKMFGIEIQNATDRSICKIRRSIGIITQSNNLLKDINVLENVMMPMLICGSNEEDARYFAIQALQDVGLVGYENRSIFELSGGEQKRVAVARALVRNPRLIIADEATSNLDLANADNILNLCMDLVLKRGSALIWTTHDTRSDHLFDRNLVLTRADY